MKEGCGVELVDKEGEINKGEIEEKQEVGEVDKEAEVNKGRTEGVTVESLGLTRVEFLFSSIAI